MKSMPDSARATHALELPAAKLVPLDIVRTRLAVFWLGGAAIIFALVVLQSLLGKYEDKTQEAWGWLLPTIMPSLGMIITVLGYTALEPVQLKAVVRGTFFQVALWLSVFYLLMVVLTILIQPFASSTATEAIALMQTSNLWLGPFQGLVASALGVLFVSKQKKGVAAP